MTMELMKEDYKNFICASCKHLNKEALMDNQGIIKICKVKEEVYIRKVEPYPAAPYVYHVPFHCENYESTMFQKIWGR